MTPEEIDRITLTVYRQRLNDSSYAGPGEMPADRQVREDEDNGEKQMARSRCFRPVVVATLAAVGLHTPERRAPPAAARSEDIFA